MRCLMEAEENYDDARPSSGSYFEGFMYDYDSHQSYANTIQPSCAKCTRQLRRAKRVIEEHNGVKFCMSLMQQAGIQNADRQRDFLHLPSVYYEDEKDVESLCPPSISQFIAHFENIRMAEDGATQGPYAKLWFVLWATDHSRMYEDECDPNDKIALSLPWDYAYQTKIEDQQNFPQHLLNPLRFIFAMQNKYRTPLRTGTVLGSASDTELPGIDYMLEKPDSLFPLELHKEQFKKFFRQMPTIQKSEPIMKTLQQVLKEGELQTERNQLRSRYIEACSFVLGTCRLVAEQFIGASNDVSVNSCIEAYKLTLRTEDLPQKFVVWCIWEALACFWLQFLGSTITGHYRMMPVENFYKTSLKQRLNEYLTKRRDFEAYQTYNPKKWVELFYLAQGRPFGSHEVAPQNEGGDDDEEERSGVVRQKRSWQPSSLFDPQDAFTYIKRSSGYQGGYSTDEERRREQKDANVAEQMRGMDDAAWNAVELEEGLDDISIEYVLDDEYGGAAGNYASFKEVAPEVLMRVHDIMVNSKRLRRIMQQTEVILSHRYDSFLMRQELQTFKPVNRMEQIDAFAPSVLMGVNKRGRGSNNSLTTDPESRRVTLRRSAIDANQVQQECAEEVRKHMKELNLPIKDTDSLDQLLDKMKQHYQTNLQSADAKTELKEQLAKLQRQLEFVTERNEGLQSRVNERDTAVARQKSQEKLEMARIQRENERLRGQLDEQTKAVATDQQEINQVIAKQQKELTSLQAVNDALRNQQEQWESDHQKLQQEQARLHALEVEKEAWGSEQQRLQSDLQEQKEQNERQQQQLQAKIRSAQEQKEAADQKIVQLQQQLAETRETQNAEASEETEAVKLANQGLRRRLEEASETIERMEEANVGLEQRLRQQDQMQKQQGSTLQKQQDDLMRMTEHEEEMREQNETQQQKIQETEAANEQLRQNLEQAQERNAALQERVRGLTETAANDGKKVNSAIDLLQEQEAVNTLLQTELDAAADKAARVAELEEELKELQDGMGGEQDIEKQELEQKLADLERQLEQAQGQEQETAKLQQELRTANAALRRQQVQVQRFKDQAQELEARKDRLEVVIQQMQRERLEREQGSDQRCMEELLDASSALNSALGKVTQRVERHEAASNGGEVDGCVVKLYELQNDLITAIYNVARTRGCLLYTSDAADE